MRRSQRLVSLSVLFALCTVLAGCGGGFGSNFDPTDLLDWLDTKKKLPGDRKPVFPEGVPGLTPGVPKEYYRGAQAEPDVQPAIPDEPKPAKQPKGRKTAAAPSRAPVQVAPHDENVTEEGEPAAVPAAPASAKPKIVRRRTTAPPPDPEPAPAPAAQQAPAQAASPFPAPLPSGTFQR